jgi:hypothetical protein
MVTRRRARATPPAPKTPSFIERALALSGGRLSLSRSLALASPRGAPFAGDDPLTPAAGPRSRGATKKKKRAKSGGASRPDTVDPMRFVGGLRVPHGTIGGNAFGGNRPRDEGAGARLLPPTQGSTSSSAATNAQAARAEALRGMVTSLQALLLHRRSGGSEATYVAQLVGAMREHDARRQLVARHEPGIPDRDSDVWALADAEAREAATLARELQYQMAGVNATTGDTGGNKSGGDPKGGGDAQGKNSTLASRMPTGEAAAAAAAAAAASVNVFESPTFLARHASARDPGARAACDTVWRVLFKEPDGTVHAAEFVPFARRVIRALLPLAPPALISPLAEEEYRFVEACRCRCGCVCQFFLCYLFLYSQRRTFGG